MSNPLLAIPALTTKPLEIRVVRMWFTQQSTVSSVYFDGVFKGYALEDFDRGLVSTMPLKTIQARKVRGETAIPAGRYELVISYSDKFRMLMPLLLNVPGFGGVRLHTGNVASHSDGCILVGLTRTTDFVGDSRKAFSQWFPLIQSAIKTRKVFIAVERAG